MLPTYYDKGHAESATAWRSFAAQGPKAAKREGVRPVDMFLNNRGSVRTQKRD
jgi:hypothetical protein